MKIGTRIKQLAELEVFDGPPLFDLDGRDLSWDELQQMDLKRRCEIGIDANSLTDHEREGMSLIHTGLALPIKNRHYRENNHNIVTTLGLQMMVDYIVTDSTETERPDGMKLGIGSTAEALGDTDVASVTGVTGSDFQAFLSGYPNDTGTGVEFKSYWAAGDATHSGLREVVLIENWSSANAVSRVLFAQIPKGASDTLAITITWTFQNG